jgi:hypothetical protein
MVAVGIDDEVDVLVAVGAVLDVSFRGRCAVRGAEVVGLRRDAVDGSLHLEVEQGTTSAPARSAFQVSGARSQSISVGISPTKTSCPPFAANSCKSCTVFGRQVRDGGTMMTR